MSEESELKIMCPFCNAVQPSDFQVEIDSISEGCDTCGYGSSAELKAEVSCRSCGRVVYVKEFDSGY